MENTLYFGPFYEHIVPIIYSASGLKALILNFSLGSFIFLCLSALAPQTILHHRTLRIMSSKEAFLFVSIVFIFFMRGLFIYQDQLNPDEGMHLTVALNLLSSPKLWVSADPTTLGPVCQLLLVLMSFIFNGISYALARITGTLCIIFTFIFLFHVLRVNLSLQMGKIISLFYVFFSALIPHYDVQAFNCEIVGNIVIAAAIYFIFSISQRKNFKNIFSLGLCIGLLPYVKLQNIPIAAALSLWFFGEELYSYKERFIKKDILIFSIALLFPSLSLTIYCATYEQGLTKAFFYYFLNANDHIPALFPLSQFITTIINFFNHYHDYRSIFYISVVAIFFLWRCTIKRELLSASLLIFAAFFSVLRPHIAFSHYLWLLIIPTLIFFMTVIRNLIQSNQQWIKLIIPVFFLSIYMIMFKNFLNKIDEITDSAKNNLIGINASNQRWYELSKTLKDLTSPQDSIVVWGWEERLHVYTNLKSATAQNNIERVVQSHYHPKNMDFYLKDIMNNKPKVIIDVVAPDSFGFNTPNFALSEYLPIYSFVKRNYTLDRQIKIKDGTYKVYLQRIS